MQPVVIYDGDCGICTRLAELLARVFRRRESDFGIVAFQHTDLSTYAVTAAQCEAALQWVAADGSVSAAQDAVARALLASRLWARPLGLVLVTPGVNAIAGIAYRWVAANRHRLPGGTPACSMPTAQRPR